MLNAPEHPLYNRDIHGLFAPGSTIKPFYAVEYLNQGVVNPSFKIFDRGTFILPGTEHVFHDWWRPGHGWVNLSTAIMVSCDTFFYTLAANHRLMCDFAAKRREVVKILARRLACRRSQCGVEIARAVKLHLRQQEGFAVPHRKGVRNMARTMQHE